jgi:predicted nucleic acid-binding protein
MILVDTTVWVDHLREGDKELAALLDAGMVLTHPFVIGEIALGYLRPRGAILRMLSDLPASVVATHEEALAFVEKHKLFGRGIGYIDIHLLAAVQLTGSVKLMTRDKRLYGIADELGLATARQ